jgi:hypothetical protein
MYQYVLVQNMYNSTDQYVPVRTVTKYVPAWYHVCWTPKRGTDLVFEHHSIHVTHIQYRFPQAYDIKQDPLQYFCKHSACRYVPSTYLGQTIRTWYVLGVKSTYSCVRVHICTDLTHTSFSIRNRHRDTHESPSDACPTLCRQNRAYPKSPRLSGRQSEACHVRIATATCWPQAPRRCCHHLGTWTLRISLDILTYPTNPDLSRT